jgi:hypothetical protein
MEFMAFTKEEKTFIRLLVERELREIEKHEHDFTSLLSNSPVLSQLQMKHNEINFLASQEKYHTFLKALKERLE